MDPVGLPQDRATAGGKYALVASRQFIDDSLFDVAKALLAFPLEVLPYRTAQSLLDHVVGIRERHTQAAGQLPSDGGLARTGQSDEGDFQGTLGLSHGFSLKGASKWRIMGEEATSIHGYSDHCRCTR